MSRKDWSEYRRQEEIERLYDRIEQLEIKLDHLQSDEWQKPYPKDRQEEKMKLKKLIVEIIYENKSYALCPQCIKEALIQYERNLYPQYKCKFIQVKEIKRRNNE